MSSSILNRRNFLSLGTGMAALMAHGASRKSDPAVKKYFRKAKALGTDVKITVLDRDEEIARKGIDSALNKIEHVEQLMSLYSGESTKFAQPQGCFTKSPSGLGSGSQEINGFVQAHRRGF